MPKKDMKSALKGSLKQEEKAVNDRFERAERLLSDKESSSPPTEISAETVKIAQPSALAVPEPKVIRDSFTMPQSDYDLISALKKRALECSLDVTKSELLRAGLKALEKATPEEFAQNVNSVEKIKTGRPKQNNQ